MKHTQIWSDSRAGITNVLANGLWLKYHSFHLFYSTGQSSDEQLVVRLKRDPSKLRVGVPVWRCKILYTQEPVIQKWPSKDIIFMTLNVWITIEPQYNYQVDNEVLASHHSWSTSHYRDRTRARLIAAEQIHCCLFVVKAEIEASRF